MQKILEDYQVRKSNKQKTKFISYLKERLKNSDYSDDDIKIEKAGKWIFKSRNIIVGNPETSDIIVTAHYDTCAVSPVPNLIFPTNIVMYLLFQLLLTFLIFFTAWVVSIPFILFFENPLVYSSIFSIVVILLLNQMMFGYPNKHNANDNTSGVIALINILENLPKEKRNRICVVFFDNEEKGLFGSSFFEAKHRIKKSKLLINLDCIGDGNHILMMPKKQAKQDKMFIRLNELMENEAPKYNMVYKMKIAKPLMFPSDQAHFNKGVGICTLKKSIIGLYAGRIHTPFDNICEKRNIDCISNTIIKLLLEENENV